MKKIGKDKIIIFALAYLVLSTTLFAVFNNDKANVNDSGTSTEDATSDNPTFNEQTENIILEGLTDDELNDVKKTMDTFTEFSFIKTTVSQEKEPNRSTTKEDIIATINFKDMSVSFEPETDKSFEEIFGFNYKGYDNAYDMMIALMETQGINTNFERADFSEILYENVNQMQYVLLDNSPIFEKMLEEIEYDEVINTSAQYNLMEYTEGHYYISCITASVKYRIGEKIMMYTICYDITLPESSGCGCGCGSIEGSTCTDDECEICNEESNYN